MVGLLTHPTRDGRGIRRVECCAGVRRESNVGAAHHVFVRRPALLWLARKGGEMGGDDDDALRLPAHTPFSNSSTVWP